MVNTIKKPVSKKTKPAVKAKAVRTAGKKEPRVAANKLAAKKIAIDKQVVPKVVAEEAARPVGRKKHFYAVGRRKSAIAQVHLTFGSGEFKINERDFKEYFPTAQLQAAALAPLQVTNKVADVDFAAVVKGGGVRGQADSVRHGLARALVQMEQEYKPVVKKMGFLTRDSRIKERKKYGLKRARRAPQWQKR